MYGLLFKDRHFVIKDELKLNNAVNICLITLNVFYIMLFHQIFMNIQNTININTIMLSTEKSFETLPKHNGAAFISECFALNLYISILLTNLELPSPL